MSVRVLPTLRPPQARPSPTDNAALPFSTSFMSAVLHQTSGAPSGNMFRLMSTALVALQAFKKPQSESDSNVSPMSTPLDLRIQVKPLVSVSLDDWNRRLREGEDATSKPGLKRRVFRGECR